MHDIFHHLEEQKNLFCFSQACFGLRAVFGIFWPSEGLRPSSGQKNPSNSPKAKTSLAKAKKVFCYFEGWEMSCIDPKIPFFFNYRTIFPVQKVSFLAAKIPIGRKSFLSLSARKKRKGYMRKKCPIIKNGIVCSKKSLYSSQDFP